MSGNLLTLSYCKINTNGIRKSVPFKQGLAPPPGMNLQMQHGIAPPPGMFKNYNISPFTLR